MTFICTSCKFFVTMMFSERCVFIVTLKSSHFWARSTNKEMHEQSTFCNNDWGAQNKLSICQSNQAISDHRFWSSGGAGPSDLLLNTRDLGTELHLWSQKINHHHEGHDHISTRQRETPANICGWCNTALTQWHFTLHLHFYPIFQPRSLDFFLEFVYIHSNSSCIRVSASHLLRVWEKL